ncbi:MAG: hypothetical protein LBF15_01890 [Candidatus Peribacteria bacterium]|nr:hypothetical protein [Candidatus Peribacteria bacterium]
MKKKFQVPKNQRIKVEATDVQKVLSNASGIPISNLSKDDTQKLKELEKHLKDEIIGQDEAITSIIKSIMRSKAGI